MTYVLFYSDCVCYSLSVKPVYIFSVGVIVFQFFFYKVSILLQTTSQYCESSCAGLVFIFYIYLLCIYCRWLLIILKNRFFTFIHIGNEKNHLTLKINVLSVCWIKYINSFFLYFKTVFYDFLSIWQIDILITNIKKKIEGKMHKILNNICLRKFWVFFKRLKSCVGKFYIGKHIYILHLSLWESLFFKKKISNNITNYNLTEIYQKN